MKEQMKIKVIKKGEVRSNAKKPVAPTKRAAARDMVTNVTKWVSDLQGRKRDETKAAIEKFFTAPQPSEL